MSVIKAEFLNFLITCCKTVGRKMIKSALLVSVLIGLSYGGPETLKKIKDHIDTWNWDVQCWGENNVVQHKMMEKNVCEQCMHTPINTAIKAKPLQHKIQALHSSPLMQQIPANFMQVPASNYNLGYPYGNTWAHNKSPPPQPWQKSSC